MSVLSLLEKRLPFAKQLLQEASASVPIARQKVERLWQETDLSQCESLCVYGISGALYALARPWLEEERSRRLFFIEEEGKQLAHLLQDEEAFLLLQDPQVKIFCLESPLQLEPLAKQIGWQTVFQEIAFLLLEEGEQGKRFQKELAQAHLAAHLLLSEHADWGVEIARNAKANRGRLLQNGLSLKGKFSQIPAIVVGAGPSLEKNGHLLQEISQKALLFAGGTALNLLNVRPHFAAGLDPIASSPSFKESSFLDAPFCLQSRMNRENVAALQGPALLFPDSSAAWLNELQGMEGTWESGWTVGNFMASLACFLGCSPIIFVGMDLCYQEGRKYAQIEGPSSEGLVSTETADGQRVWTQKDWLMAARWMEDLAERHPETVWINATEGGLGFASPIVSKPLASVLREDLRHVFPLEELVSSALQAAPVCTDLRLGWERWKQSLLRCQRICQDVSAFDLSLLEDELVYQKLLTILWQIWKPVFERELELDPQPLPLGKKIELHKILFFQQVIQEHLDVCS